MLHKLKPVPRALVILGIVGGGVYAALNVPAVSSYFQPKATVAVAVPGSIDLPAASTIAIPAASTAITAAATTNEQIRVETIPWNGTLGMMHAKASGGFAARGLNVDIKRQDDSAQLKLALLTFGMTVFLTRSTIDVVKSIPQSDIDYARSLGLHGWALTWELVIRGRAADMLDLVRQNAAVGWTLLAMVEGITRSEGGIGALLLNQNKYFKLDAVFAIQFMILFYGIIQDIGLAYIRGLVCPWTRLNRSDK